MPISLLIGNGFNRTDQMQPSWKGILRDVARDVGEPSIIENYDHKPETLIFEQLSFADGKTHKEGKIKSQLAEKMLQLAPNGLHKKAIASGVRHILSTNYDYNFETAGGLQASEIRRMGSRETKYSLYRKHEADHTNIWHIHGEARSPNTIMLGFEHYAGSLQNLRAYATADRSARKNQRVSYFKQKIEDFDEKEEQYSWIDVFFRDDIHIIGLSLDYTESDIWWAITYKHTLRFHSNEYKLGKTFYHYMPSSENDGKSKASKLRAKIEVLRSLGVEPKPFQSGSKHIDAYQNVLDIVSNSVNSSNE